MKSHEICIFPGEVPNFQYFNPIFLDGSVPTHEHTKDLGQALALGGAGCDRCRGRWQLPTGGVYVVAEDPAEDAGECVPWFSDVFC